MTPDDEDIDYTVDTPSPYDEETPVQLVIRLIDEALHEVGMAYPLFTNAQIAISEISTIFKDFGMEDYEGVLRRSTDPHRMGMLYKRLWSTMRNYFITPRHKELNSIKQLIVHSIVLTITCIGENGDIKNESGKGRLWKGTDEDRLFYHNVFLNKWDRHMKKLGYPFPEATLGTLKYGARVVGASAGMCVPKC
jgi:hypothetical protein